MKWFTSRWHSDMLRPFIYKVFTRGVLALLAAQLVHFFAPSSWPLAAFSNLSLALGLLFALFAFLAWLRMDGLKIPHLKLPRLKRTDPAFLKTDLADHLDDDLVSFEDLDPADRDFCVFLADLALMGICLLLVPVL